MKTLQEKYNAIQEGNFSKEQFLRDARLELPNLITQYNGYNDAVNILKNRGMIQEAIKETVNTGTETALKEARLTKNSLTDYRYKPTNDMDKYPYEQILRGLRVELEGMNVQGTPTPDEYKKALAKVLKSLEKDEIFYTNRVAGIKADQKRNDQMIAAEKNNTVDTVNGLKKAELKEGFKNLIRKILVEDQERYKREAQDGGYGTEKEYEFYNSEEPLKEEVEEKGLMIVGRTQVDNNAIGDVLDELDLYGEWNAREGYWLLPEEEENYDELETVLDQEFGKRGINARFEGIFNEELTNKKTSLSELLK